MEFLYTDKKIAVCIKPAGVLSTDEPGGMPSLVREALGEGSSAYTVHRLDRVVGGVFVMALTRHAASDLGKAVQDGDFHKEYLAVVHGSLPEKAGRFADLLRRDRKERRTLVVRQPGKDVREAVLDYSVLAEREDLSLVRIVLHTGRTHQIRCQFSHRGYPLVGDGKYGAPEEAPLALWSERVRFPHPVTGESMEFSEAPPAVWPWTIFTEGEPK